MFTNRWMNLKKNCGIAILWTTIHQCKGNICTIMWVNLKNIGQKVTQNVRYQVSGREESEIWVRINAYAVWGLVSCLVFTVILAIFSPLSVAYRNKLWHCNWKREDLKYFCSPTLFWVNQFNPREKY